MTYFQKIVNGYLRPVSETNYVAIYSETWVPGITTPSGTNVTLPNSGTYTGKELQIYINGILQTYLIDYVYIGSGTKTQVSFNLDLKTTDSIQFIRLRNE